jgi:hypothetical protein
MAGAFGMSTLREDGFVSLDATGHEGFLETRLLEPPAGADTIRLNCCPFDTDPTRAPMEVKVLLTAGDESVVSAHELIPVADPDHTWYRIRLNRQIPSPCKLRFHLKNCRLYSFQFTTSKPGATK